MSGFTTHTGRIAVYNSDHVDTDRIIPARFLSMVTRSGYGELLFADVKGPDFPLDQPEAKGADILIVGTNFGCGSSREHAVWAIQQAGYKVVIAKITDDSPAYSDIFRGNAGNCGLALIDLSAADHDAIAALGSGAEVSIDLPNQTVTSAAGIAKFEIGEATKMQLIAGLDLVGMTMQHEDKIREYESQLETFIPTGVTA